MLDRDLKVCFEILTHCDDVIDKMRHYSFDIKSWEHDRFNRDSVLMSLGQIGEAVTHFKTEGDIARYPDELSDVNWSDIRGMRNVLYHHYRAVDLDAAWVAATKDVFDLKERLLKEAAVKKFYVEQSLVPPLFDISEELETLPKLAPVRSNPMESGHYSGARQAAKDIVTENLELDGDGISDVHNPLASSKCEK